MKLKIDLNDWEFLEGNTQYIYELPDTNSEVNVKISADAFVEIWLEGNEKMFPLQAGTNLDLQISCLGFNSVHLKAAKKTKIAAQITAKKRGEERDNTPLAVSMQSSKEMTLKEAVRAAIIEELGLNHVNPELVDELDLDIFDGDFDDDVTEDLSQYQLDELEPDPEPEPDPEAESDPEPAPPPVDPDREPEENS